MEEIWVMALAAVGLLVRVGMTIYSTGLSRSKNAAGTLARHLCDWCVATLALFILGAAILGQLRNQWFAIDPAMLFGNGRAGAGAWLLHLLMCLLASGIAVGAVGERSRFAVVGALSFVIAGLIVPILGHWAWYGGWLYSRGFIDLGGAGVVHLSGAVAATVAAVLVGPRSAKYNRDGSANGIPGHNVPLMGLGVLLMLAAWVPYLMSALVHFASTGPTLTGPIFSVAMKITVAAAAAGLVAMWYTRFHYGKVDVPLTCAGLLGGLVAISAGAHVVHPGWALLIGAVAGLIVPVAAVQMDLRMKIDDPVASIAIHGVGGAWGLLATGLFSNADSLARSLVAQLMGLAAIIAISATLTALVLLPLKATLGLRASEADEYDGLDLAEHDINAYPDFQQTMIKSYHLREA